MPNFSSADKYFAADMFVSSTYKLDETGDRIVRIPGIPSPSNAKEDSKEQLERTQALAKYVEVLKELSIIIILTINHSYNIFLSKLTG